MNLFGFFSKRAPRNLARKLANEIAETRDLGRWKELMNLFHDTSDPKEKVEILRIAAALAMASGIETWKFEVNAKMLDLRQRGQL